MNAPGRRFDVTIANEARAPANPPPARRVCTNEIDVRHETNDANLS
jgi:hypothetical protein